MRLEANTDEGESIATKRSKAILEHWEIVERWDMLHLDVKEPVIEWRIEQGYRLKIASNHHA